MFKKSDNHNPNYLAKVVKLEQPVKHPNADKLQGFVIDHNRVWTDLSYSPGDICVYFPVECCINPELLSFLNLFRDKELNADKEKAGFFEYHGRVKALKLRGEPSEGFLLKFEVFKEWLLSKSFSDIDKFYIIDDYNFSKIIGDEFDYFDNTWVCKKYIPKGSEKKTSNNAIRAKKKITELIVENQFRLHRDTEQFKKNLNKFDPEDIVSITYKLHGTSAVFSNILVKRVLSPFERHLRFFGVNIQKTKYGNVYSSRKVIKDVDGKSISDKSFYEEDIWKIVNEEVKDKILQGISLYGEIVGHLPSGKMIQEQYDYGCSNNNHEFYVYRITYTNPEGHVFEFSWQDIKDYCNKYGLKHVPEMYYGTAVNLEKQLFLNSDSWHEHFLITLEDIYLEKDCFICTNSVPAEGVCIRKESGDKEAYKLKSFRFLNITEAKLNDSDELDIETLESLM